MPLKAGRVLGKIPTMFERDWQARGRPVIDKIAAACDWVLAGEGRATRKWDGTPIAVITGRVYRRLDYKPGRIMPVDWLAGQPEPDPITGEQPGWIPLDPIDKADRRVLSTISERWAGSAPPDGTYEFCGPTVNGNPEGFATHQLLAHGSEPVSAPDRSFNGLRALLADGRFEGVVFHHADGRMAKIKGRDFGIRRAAP